MKKKDFGIIFIVAVFSAVLSIILSGMIFSTPEDRKQSVEVVEAISIDFQYLDDTYFNSNSVNPARRIQTGQEPNSRPFSGPFEDTSQSLENR